MAKHESHLSFSIVLAICYAAASFFLIPVYPEHLILSVIIFIIASSLPNIDNSESPSCQELCSFFPAIITVITLYQLAPNLIHKKVVILSLIVVLTYAVSRWFFVKILTKYTVHRGMIHSIPSSIIVFELTFLLFWDTPLTYRLYLAVAAFSGFFSHLLMDAYGNSNIIGKAMGKPKAVQPVLKLAGNSKWATIIAYLLCISLGWLCAINIDPNLDMKSITNIKY